VFINTYGFYPLQDRMSRTILEVGSDAREPFRLSIKSVYTSNLKPHPTRAKMAPDVRPAVSL